MNIVCWVLLVASAGAVGRAQVVDRGLILDLDADRGVQVAAAW